MFEIKTPEEIEIMRASSLLASDTLSYIASILQPGMTGDQLDSIAEEYINDHDALPGFKGYNGFPGSLCISINECIVHGLPGSRAFREGDLVSVDCGILKNKYYGDVAFTFGLEPLSDEVKTLLHVTRECLALGISKAVAGNRTGDIGHAVQHHAQKTHGYGVVRELVGHGLGRNLHESPEVPNYGRRGTGTKLLAGMTIAIEPMINMGTRRVKQLKDGWGIITKDRKPSAHYEHDVAIGVDAPDVLSDHDRIVAEVKKNNNLYDFSDKK